MSDIDRAKFGETAAISLKILYTLHGVDSQKYIVKPSEPVEARVFRDLELGVVNIQPCLNAIREVSPDFMAICDTHSEEYAVYSTDYAEDGLPLQSHGKVSHAKKVEATGRLSFSKLMREQLELLIHFLPIRKPEDMIADFQQKAKSDSFVDVISTPASNSLPDPQFAQQTQPAQHAQHPQQHSQHHSQQQHSQSQPHPQHHKNLFAFPLPPPSFMNSSLLPPLPPQVQIPSSLTSGSSLKSDQVLPSSPPVRAKPNKLNTINANSLSQDSNGHGSQHTDSSATPPTSSLTSSAKLAGPEPSIGKKRKALSPKNDNGEAQCGNCGVATASTWRRARCPDGKGELLCNACGLYYRAKKVMRPRFLWDKMRSRGDQENMLNSSAAEPQSSSSANHSDLVSSSSAFTNSAANASQNTSVTNRISKLPSIAANTPTPQDSAQTLWSQEHGSAAAAATYLTSDPSELSDRLIDNPSSQMASREEPRLPPVYAKPQKIDPIDSVIARSQASHDPSSVKRGSPSTETSPSDGTAPSSSEQPAPEVAIQVPNTPERKTNFAPLEPDSMQKWLGLSTPDQRLGFMIPGSGSARKWLDKAMNPSHFDEIWNSPTPRKIKSSIPDLALFTSSPPTSSSNMLSEVAEWNLANGSPGTPQALKFFRGEDENDLERENVTSGKSVDSPQSRPTRHASRCEETSS